jgi:hypothetical protein
MYLQLLGYALVGKLIIYLAQIFPKQKLPIIGKLFAENRFFGELFACDLCTGFWVYFLLDFMFRVNFLQETFYVTIVSEAISGAILAFIMHLLSIGFRTKYFTINMD